MGDRLVDKLTDMAVRKAKPREKAYKLSDGKGLRLVVNPNGAKWWHFYYTWEGKENTLSFGVYPEVSLSEAREKRNVTRKMLANGVNPGAERRQEKADSTSSFQHVAVEWLEKVQVLWTEGHARTVIRRLERDVFPFLGKHKIDEIAASDVLKVLERVEERGAIETAHRILVIFNQIFKYAISTGRTSINPAYGVKGALRPVQQRHYPAITKPDELRELLRSLDAYRGTYTVKCALRLLPMLFVRSGELRKAEWTEVDFTNNLWTIPASRMKARKDHIVPLSRQAVGILSDLQQLTGSSRYVFPTPRSEDRPLGENAFVTALRAMGYGADQIVAHSFRATARTMLDEILHYPPHVIEAQLAHCVRDALGTAYNRTSYLPERTEMMQAWSDFLDRLKNGAQIIVFQKAL